MQQIKKRFYKHNSGQVTATKGRRPFRLIYYEACINKRDALHREKYLKTTWGKRFINTRLKNFFEKAPQLDRSRPSNVAPLSAPKGAT
ncbi:hypothetical protein A3E41_00115 [Candidatus Woesebacteria bacterium RIFCSPHIGHO2_12_FULL_38_9]|nr:MAG: hypothetical protein A3E41_00115 [Candidatus Woesebacteria bacterium RIFCSPHIGHO2_12_FULL_38_9]